MFQDNGHDAQPVNSWPRHVLWAQTLGASVPVDSTSPLLSSEDFVEYKADIARQNALYRKHARVAEKRADPLTHEIRRLDAEIATVHQGHRVMWEDTQIWQQQLWVAEQKVHELELRAKIRTDAVLRQDMQVYALQEELERERFAAQRAASKYAHDLQHLEEEASAQLSALHAAEQKAEMSTHAAALEERVASEEHAHMKSEVRESTAECTQLEVKNQGFRERIRVLQVMMLREEHAKQETLRRDIDSAVEAKLKTLQADLKKAARELRSSAFEIQQFRAVLLDPSLQQLPAVVDLLAPIVQGLGL